MKFPGLDGFLGTRASLMLDVVFVAMFVVLPVLAWSVYQVRVHRRYRLHKRVQIGLAIVVAVAVTLFEVDIRLHGWEERAAGEIGGEASPLVWRVLKLHLVFAIATPFLWAFVIFRALRKFPAPPAPCPYSGRHRVWGRLAALSMLLTGVTGWAFYVVAFVL